MRFLVAPFNTQSLGDKSVGNDGLFLFLPRTLLVFFSADDVISR